MKRLSGLSRAALVAGIVAAALAPSVALADAGSDQYCDPFGGCQINGGGGAGGGAHTGAKPAKGKAGGQALTPEQQTYFAAAMQRDVVGKLRAEINSLSPAAQAAVSAQFAKARRLNCAEKVLDAAGLSPIGSSLRFG
jgi:hypothetical protein